MWVIPTIIASDAVVLTTNVASLSTKQDSDMVIVAAATTKITSDQVVDAAITAAAQPTTRRMTENHISL